MNHKLCNPFSIKLSRAPPFEKTIHARWRARVMAVIMCKQRMGRQKTDDRYYCCCYRHVSQPTQGTPTRPTSSQPPTQGITFQKKEKERGRKRERENYPHLYTSFRYQNSILIKTNTIIHFNQCPINPLLRINVWEKESRIGIGQSIITKLCIIKAPSCPIVQQLNFIDHIHLNYQ